MKKNIIIAITAIVAVTACTEDPISNARTPIEIGGMTIAAATTGDQTRADASLFFTAADQITVTATGTPLYTAAYTYAAAAGTWTPVAAPLYLEDVYANQVPTHTFGIAFGQHQADQSTAAALHQADRVEGPATLALTGKVATLTAPTLSRKHLLVEATIVKGTNWATDAEFLAYLNPYTCTFNTQAVGSIVANNPSVAVYQAIMHPSQMPATGSILFTLGNQAGETINCRYTPPAGTTPTAGTRMKITATLNNTNTGNLELTTVTVAGWEIGNDNPTLPGTPATILATIPAATTRAAAEGPVKTTFTTGDRITILHQIGAAPQTTEATLNAAGQWTTPAPFYLDTRAGAAVPTATYNAGGAPTLDVPTGVTTYYDNLAATATVNLTATPPTAAFAFAHTNALITVTINGAAPTATLYIYVTTGAQTLKLATNPGGQCIAPPAATIATIETPTHTIVPTQTITTAAGQSYTLNITADDAGTNPQATITPDGIPNWTNNNPDATGARLTNTDTMHYIYDAAGLAAAFRYEVHDDNKSLNAVQMANITLTGNWEPIAGYEGTYNGNGYTISGLKVETNSDAGLFGYVSNATLINIHLVDVYVKGTSTERSVGALVAIANQATIALCSSTGTVIGIEDAGGLIGYASDNVHITRCLSTCNVVSTSGTDKSAGGLVGISHATIVACMAGGEVSAPNGYAGGFAGSNFGTISHCYATGKATGKTSGGFIGLNNDAIGRSYTTRTSFAGYAGGAGTLTNTWYTGSGTATPKATVRAGTSAAVRTWDGGQVVTRNFDGTKIFTDADYPMIDYSYAGEK